LDEVLQLLLNGIMSGAVLALPAIGFTVIYAVLRFPNFSVASHTAVGAYAGYLANQAFALPAPLAAMVAFSAAGIVGVASDEATLRPLRRSGALVTAIGSVALTIALENVLRFGFGNELREFELPIARDWRMGALRIEPQQVENLLLAALAVAVLFAFLRFTRTGKAMRAVADNPTLADVKGIDPLRVARLVNFLGMGLAGFGGVLLGLDTGVDPLTGFRALLSIFAAAVVGGLGSIPGAVVGALAVGIAEELSLVWVAPTYRTAVGFVGILLILTLRPRGLLGERAY